MADLLHLIDGIVNEYLKTKDKNLAKVFETKTKAVSFFLVFFYLFFTASSFKCICMPEKTVSAKMYMHVIDEMLP